jgi:nucleotide-binding universal stress UspA family protein
LEAHPPVVLACIDLHKRSAMILQHAFDYAVGQGADVVHGVFVSEPNLANVKPPEELEAPELTGIDHAKLQAFAQEQLDELCKRRPDCKPPRVEIHTLTGDPAHKIVELAAALDADLIVMATHGRKGLKHFLMGSVSEKVVRTAGCPVMVLREKAHPKGA